MNNKQRTPHFSYMSKSLRGGAVLLLLLCATVASADELIKSELTYQRFTTADGLPQMQTETIFQDANGYIYIGTLSGFVRYDGITLTPFLKGRRENIVAFAEIDGKVRALGFRRQWEIDGNDTRMLPIDSKNHWLLNNFNSPCLPNGLVMLEDKNEENRKICRIEKDGMQTLFYGTFFDRMTPDRKITEYDGALYMPCAEGLFRIDKKGKATRISRKTDFYTLHEMNDTLYALAADGVYVLDEEKGKRDERLLLSLKPSSLYSFEAPDYGLAACHNDKGELYIADAHNIYLYRQGQITCVTRGFNMIKDIFVDCWGRLWAATYQGAYCFFGCNFTNYRLTDNNDIVRAIGIDGDDNMFFGTLNGKLISHLQTSPRRGGLPTTPSLQISPPFWEGSEVGHLEADFYQPWAARLDGQIYMINNNGVIRIGKKASPSGGRLEGAFNMLRLPEDKWRFIATGKNRLIIGSRKQIVAYYPASDAIDTLTTQVYQPWIAAEDRKGNVYIGTTLGLYKIDSSTDKPKKLIGEQNKSIITAMTTDNKGNILFATADSLFSIRNDSITSLYTEQLRNHEIRAIHVTKSDYLIVATIDGMLVADMKEKDKQQFFDHRSGFTMIEPQMATIGETTDGRVWIAGLEEMAAFYPAELLNSTLSDTIVRMPLKWWQRWWAWLLAALCLIVLIWIGAYQTEKRRNKKAIGLLRRETQQRQQQLEAIRTAVDDYMANSINKEELAKQAAEITAQSEDDDILQGTGKIAFRTTSGKVFIDESNIAYILADGNYAQVITFEDTEMVLESLAKLERRLNSRWFVRADRKTIINRKAIYKINPKRGICTLRSSSGITKEIEITKGGMERLN